jgi:hypothetical protein
MAVIEIAKIQVRRGQENQTGVPQLDGGEFAWAADTEKLYIGLRREDGGSRDANVEILTENHIRNFFATNISTSTNQIQYTYREGTNITAPGGTEEEVVRVLQDKLDDIVSVQDFDVYGDGTDWDTANLQLAINRLFLNTKTLSPHPAKKLYFPAGNYIITDTIYIPTGTTLIGDGIGKTFLTITTGSSLLKTCDLPQDLGPTGEPNSWVVFDNALTFTSPVTVNIEDMTLQADPEGTTITSALNLLNLDSAINSVIKRVEFKGNYLYTNPLSPNENYVALDMKAFGAGDSEISASGNVIEKCIFTGFNNGILSNYDIKNLLIKESSFSNLVKGIAFNTDTPTGNGGPQHIKIENNRFDKIEEEAIYVGDNNFEVGSYVTSQNNIFNDVGNYNIWGQTASSGTAVISFLSENNSSINDHFDRLQYQNSTDIINAPASASTYFLPLIDGRSTIDNFYVSTKEINPGSTGTTFLRLPITDYSQHLNIKYSAFRPDAGLITATVITVGGSSTSTIQVADYELIIEGYGIQGIGIPVNTVITSINTSTFVLTLNNAVTISPGAAVSIFSPIDRMGNLSVYIQDSIGGEPKTILVDDYNFIGGTFDDILFSVTVSAPYNYVEVVGTIPGLANPIILETQTKLMI